MMSMNNCALASYDEHEQSERNAIQHVKQDEMIIFQIACDFVFGPNNMQKQSFLQLPGYTMYPCYNTMECFP